VLKFWRVVLVSAVIVATVACGAGDKNSRASKELRACRAVKTSPVLFNEVLVRGKPASDFSEKTLQPAKQIYDRLGMTPDETRFLANSLFRWARYGNTAYLLAALSASAPNPVAHEYVAAKACDWRSTVRKVKAAAKRLGVKPTLLGTPADE